MDGYLDYNQLYNQSIIMDLSKNDRIIDPTYDNVNEHLEFFPELYIYKAKTKIGSKTKEMFFDRDEVVRNLEGISMITKKLVIDGCSNDVLESIIQVYGHEFYYQAFFNYWVGEKAASRLR